MNGPKKRAISSKNTTQKFSKCLSLRVHFGPLECEFRKKKLKKFPRRLYENFKFWENFDLKMAAKHPPSMVTIDPHKHECTCFH